MAEINDLTTVDASNTARWPENMAPSAVNDAGRADEGLIARWHRDTNGSKASTGSPNAYVFAANQTLSAYYDGLTITFDANFTNTGAATLNVDAVSADSIVWPDGTALASGDITSGAKVTVRHDGTNWQLVSVTRALASGASAPFLDEDDMASDSATSVASQQSIKAYVDATVAVPRGYIDGLILSNNGTDADHDIDIAAGKCRDSADGTDISLSAITKQIDATWASGTNAGGLSSSLTAPANDTWYHVFAIVVSGSADVGFDTSVTAANLVSDHSATAYRRIGSVLTDGTANIIAFTQVGDHFYWDTPVQDYSTAGTTSRTLRTVSVPTGLKVWPILHHSGNGSAIVESVVTDPDLADAATSLATISLNGSGSNDANHALIGVMSNTSAQIGTKEGSTSITITGITRGWIDPRGRNG